MSSHYPSATYKWRLVTNRYRSGVALAATVGGSRDILGLWAGDGREGAK
jgi:hypothetical protein